MMVYLDSLISMGSFEACQRLIAAEKRPTGSMDKWLKKSACVLLVVDRARVS